MEKRQFVITTKYLWLPITKNVPNQAIAFLVDGIRQQEIYIGISEDTVDYYVAFSVEKYAGRRMDIEGDYTDSWVQKILQRNEYTFVNKTNACNHSKIFRNELLLDTIFYDLFFT